MKQRNYFIILIILLTVVFAAGCSAKSKSTSECGMTDSASSEANCELANAPKVFTIDELAKYNGQNGKAAYIAINSVVYDVTNYKNWQNEQLFNSARDKITAGKDLSQYVINTAKGKEFLINLPRMGGLKKS